MTTPRVGINMRVELQASLGSAKTVTDISNTNPAVATAVGHGFSNGDVVVHAVPQGMVELDGQSCRVANKTTDTYELEGIDATEFGDFEPDDGDSPPADASLCTVKKVTSFVTYANTTSASNPNVTPAKLPHTTLLDKRVKYVFGMPDSAEGSFNTIFAPTTTAERLVKTITRNQTPTVQRWTWATGQVRIFNSNIAGGAGVDQQGNAVATGSCAFTVIDEPVDYDS